MANVIEKIIQIKTDISEAASEIKDLFDNLLAKQKESEEAQEKLNQSLDETKDAAKNAEKGIGGMAKGFRGVGLAIKAIGIGLLLEAFNILKDVLSQNQKLVDGFAIGVKMLTMAFNDFFKYIEKNIGGVIDYFKDIFENPQKNIEKFGDAIKENLIERFNSFLDTLGYVAKAIKELFSGNWDAAWEEAKKAGKETIDIYTGVNNTFDRSAQALKDAGQAISDYTSGLAKAAIASVNLAKSVAIALAKNAGLIQEYETLAEKQRQIRDDEALSIADRIKANDELAKVLVKQRVAMTANASLSVKLAQTNLAENNTLENQIALINAQTEAKAILNDITGKESEQKTNQVALNKELNALNQTSIDGLNARNIKNKEFTTSLIKDTLERLEVEKKTEDEIYQLELKRLEDKRALYAKGTQSYADANEEILNLQQQHLQNLEVNDLAQEEIKSQRSLDRLNEIISNNQLEFDIRRKALDAELILLKESFDKKLITEIEYNKKVKENSDARVEIDRLETDAYLMAAQQFGNLLNTLAAASAENSSSQKSLAVAGTTINAIASGVSAYKGMVETIPGPIGIAAGAAAAAGVVLSGYASVKKILAVPIPGGKGGGGGMPSAPSAPSFNIVGQSSENQLAGTIASQQVEPIKAFVTSGDVSTQQALDRRILNNATFVTLVPFILSALLTIFMI